MNIETTDTYGNYSTINSNSQKTLNVKESLISVALFVLAGIFEVGGGYLVWIAIREKKSPYIFIPCGFVVLMCYGLIPTLQPVDSFGRTFAVYGGFFIVLSYLWGYIFDGMKLDIGDYIGSAIALTGVCVAWFWPR
eukprot:gene18001-23639_t